MKFFKLLYLSLVKHPNFTCIYYRSYDYSTVHFQFCREANVMLIHSGSSSPKCLACFTNSGGNFFVQVCIIGNYTPQVLEDVNVFQVIPSVVMVGSSGLVFGAG